MAKDKQLFIKTTDLEMAQCLIGEGLHLVSKEPGSWTFLNEPSKLNFDVKNFNNIVYCNTLSL